MHQCDQSEKIQKIYERLFENNGIKSIVTEIEDLKKFKENMEDTVIANINDIHVSLGKLEKDTYKARIIKETLDKERNEKTDKSDRFWRIFAIVTSCVFGGATVVLTMINILEK